SARRSLRRAGGRNLNPVLERAISPGRIPDVRALRLERLGVHGGSLAELEHHVDPERSGECSLAEHHGGHAERLRALCAGLEARFSAIRSYLVAVPAMVGSARLRRIV